MEAEPMKKFHKKLKKYFKRLDRQARYINEKYYDDEWELSHIKILETGIWFQYDSYDIDDTLTLWVPLDILDDEVLEKWANDNGL